MRYKNGEMNACGGTLRGGDGGEGSEGNGENKRHVGGPCREDHVGEEWGINVELLDDMDRKLLKSLLNEGWRNRKRGLRKGEENVSCDLADGKRVRSPLHETKARDGRVEDGTQASTFDRSMRVLEWLDADCGTRLARHYEQAGGWRSLPERKQRHQRTHHIQQHPPQRQQLRLARSNIVLGTNLVQDHVRDSEEDSTTSEEEKRILEESEEFCNDEDADDDDLVLALRKWQDEQLQQQEHYEDLSMQEYVTSSEDDSSDNDSDSEDELVLALKVWQEEHKRQQKLQQQHHQQVHHRQLSLAQQPPALTPVIEEKVSSPSFENFGYFYQDHSYLVYHYNKQRLKNHQQQQQQQSGVSPYWWGDISSVREGPSSPPVLLKHPEPLKSSNVLASSRVGTRPASSRDQVPASGVASSITTDCLKNVRCSGTLSVQGGATPSNAVSAAVTPSTLPATPAHGPQATLHSPLTLPSLSFVSPSPSPRFETPSWNFSNRVKTPLSPAPSSPAPFEAGSADIRSGGCAKSDNLFMIKSAAEAKIHETTSTKVNLGVYSAHTPLINKTVGGGFGAFSARLGSSSRELHDLTCVADTDGQSVNGERSSVDVHTRHKTICSSQSTASYDSGIEKSPGYLSPAPKSAGIDKIGGFFRKFHHKLSASKSTLSQTSDKNKLQPQNSRKGSGLPCRRLSLSTSSIPSSAVLKPASPSPVTKFATDHTPCAATRSDPLASNLASRRQRGQLWTGAQLTRRPAAPAGGAVNTLTIGDVCVKRHSSTAAVVDGVVTASSGGLVGGQGSCVIADGGSAASVVTQSDRRRALTIDTHGASGVSDGRKGGLTPTSTICGGNCAVKVLVVGAKEVQPFVVPQSYQHPHHHLHQQPSHLHDTTLSAKRPTRELSDKNSGQHSNDASVSAGISQSGSRYHSRDNLDLVKKSNETLDAGVADNDKASAGWRFASGINDQASAGWRFASGINSPIKNSQIKPAIHISRKSPASEIEQKIHTDSVERDPQGKIRTLFSSEVGSWGSSVSIVNNSSAGYGVESANVLARSMTDTKRTEPVPKEELTSSKYSERSSSTSSEERGSLTVPGQDRSRRGSHGTCNHLFLDQATGRKSPLPVAAAKSPSPVRSALLKGVGNSTSTSSSSSSAESSSKHPLVGRVLSISSPSSPPAHLLQPIKTPPQHLPNLQLAGWEPSPKKQVATDSPPPASYRGRRKFSDTGLTPVPRRLYSDGRRGSLTDEKTLVFAKSKLEKLRIHDRKSSDASSVAALVKQIHNLWGDGEEGGDGHNEPSTGLTCSLDDQALLDRRRLKFPLSVSPDKPGVKDGTSVGGDRKLVHQISSSQSGPSEGAVSVGATEGRGRNNTSDKATLLPAVSQNSYFGSSSYLHSVAAGHEDHRPLDKLQDALTDTAFDDISVAADSSSVGASSCGSSAVLGGSEFVGPVAQVAGRQLVATAVSSAACFVGIDTPENLVPRGTAGVTTASYTPASNNPAAYNARTNKKSATVQFQPIVSWDDNTEGESVSPALRSVLKQGARRHSSFAGFSEAGEVFIAPQHDSTESLSSVLNKQATNGLTKSRTSDNYRGILKQTDRPDLANIDSVSSSPGDKRRSKSPSPKSRKNNKSFDYSPDPKHSETSLSLCLKATRSLSPKSKKYRSETRDYQESTDQSSQATPFSSTDREQFTDSGNCSLDLPTKTVGIQATPRTIGKTSNTGTQTSDQSGGGDSSTEQSSSPPEGGGWLHRLAAKCMASVGSSSRAGSTGGPGGGLPRAASVRAEWLLGNKRMGSNPSSPVAPSSDASEKFWVPRGVLARKRAQSLVPTISKQESEDDLSSEAATPASIPHPRDLAFNFTSEKAGTSGGSSDGQPSTPPAAYNHGRRRASMHDAIDLTKIDTRLYDKKLVRQASVTSIEEESQGTVHVSLEHNSETGILTVNLVRAHNLLPRDMTCTANPYCRITLLPGQRTSAQSRIHRKTLNPEFEEEFIFELPTEEVTTSTLEVSFYEYDQFSKDECVGYVRMPLSEIDLSKPVDLWRSITPYEKPTDQRDLGDVMFSLGYLPSAERLTVVIVRARNLHLLDDGKLDLNPFIKVCITSGNKKLKKKKTTTAHSTNSPIWNEALVFSVHRESLKNIGLELSAYHDNKLGIDECIGRIRLPADSDDGIRCQELLKENTMPARWYNLS